MNTPLLQSTVRVARLLLILGLVCILSSCSHSRKEAKKQEDLPKPLQDDYNSIRLVSKRSSGDYLQSIYYDLVEKTPELKKLEASIEQFNESIGDSTKTFENFDEKNKGYYTSANMHLRSINDSVLRESIKTLVENSMKNYDSSISQHKELLASLQQKNITLDDLHEVLKITRSLPVIHQFQQRNIPSTKPLAGINQQTEKVINELRSATKQ
jgi:hypothetical protein